MLVIMILMLVGFSTGIFPKTIIDDAGVSDALFKVACGLLVTHLGTLISRKEMAAQWKTVIISLGRAMSVQRYSWRGLRGFDGLRDIHFSRREPRGERIFQARDRREQE